MVQRTPDFFLKFRKDFRFIVAFKEPVVGEDVSPTVNFVFGMHSDNQDKYCDLTKPHYHLLLEVRRGNGSSRRGHIIRCLYSCYFYLLHDCGKLQYNGEVVVKLRQAVDYNVKMGENGFFKQPKRIEEKIPVLKSKQGCIQGSAGTALQFLERICDLMNGPHASAFLRIIDILILGYGSLETDTIFFILNM